MNNSPKKIPVVSLFSGGGFLDLGFEKAGFEILFTNELDEDFAKFFNEGMSSYTNSKREISFIGSVESINKKDLRDKLNGQIFGLIGGPPCQDFSIRGSRMGLDGLKGTMTYKFYEFVLDLNPSFFLMENVPGLVMLDKTKSSFISVIDLFREQFEIDYKILNSLDFGVPQSRERLFVIGINKNIIKRDKEKQGFDSNWFNWPVPEYENARSLFKWGEPGFKDLKKDKLSPPRSLCVESILLSGAEVDKIPNASEWFNIKDIPKIRLIEEGDTYRPSFKKLHRRKFSPTVCYGNNEVHLHPFEERRLSVREALRLQGVPDEYVLATKGKLSKKFKMIGNGVPVKLAYSVASSISHFFETNLCSLQTRVSNESGSS